MKKFNYSKTVLWCVILNIVGIWNYAYAQTPVFSFSFKNNSLKEVFALIESKSDYAFLFSSGIDQELEKKITKNVSTSSINQVLDQVLASSNLEYKVNGRQVMISLSNNNKVVLSSTAPRQTTSRVVVKGIVLDENKEPLPGASITLKSNPKVGVSSSINGEFTLEIPGLNETLVINYLGMEKKEIPASTLDKPTIQSIMMNPDSKELGQVVVIGSVERRKDSFTGATTIVTGNELKMVGTQNVIESLKTLDPSFVVMENTLAGSNPNRLPTIELRGQTSLDYNTLRDDFSSDPNQPLFILDEFETTLRTILDLDMNRVASITVLKDAASTAIYGSRAANGVVVVRTVKPVAGQLQVSYTGDFSVETPDLGSYNLMNAKEKLEFERLSGRYTYGKGTTNNTSLNNIDAVNKQLELDQMYSMRLAEVLRGVDSYWLNEPLQTAFANRQSLRVSGGSDNLLLNAGLSYRNAPGVMKGSGRTTWSGNIDLTYNKGKVSIINRLNVSGYEAEESPWGSYSQYVKTNPYYRKTDETGSIPRYLEEGINNSNAVDKSYNVPNPVYNAMLNSRDQEEQLYVSDNFQAQWMISKELKLQGSLNLTKAITTTDMFTPPENTIFDNSSLFKKGAYNFDENKNFSYQANAMLTYAKVLADKHRITANIRGEVQESDMQNVSMEALGFPYGTNGKPSFAFTYVPDKGPGYVSSLYRRSNFFGSVNYAFKERYLLDATYRLDGSTVFGSDEKYQSFWGVGLGWNLHNENFLKDSDWLNVLKLRGNIGTSGNQNLGNLSSTSIYTYDKSFTPFGTGLSMVSLGNKDLKWQKTRDLSLGVDLEMFNGRLQATFDAYDKYTDPLVVFVDQPSSTGIGAYPMNLGHLDSKGIEFKVSGKVINIPQKQISLILRAFGAYVKTEYGGFDNKLASMDKASRELKSLQRFRDGSSPDDLWAVSSLGIDPMSGREVFLTKDGQYTFVHNFEDEVIVGSQRPDLKGIFGLTFTYKKMVFNCDLRYSVGGDIMNNALYTKVENISFNDVVYNQDKRALYERWQKPGDIAQFKALSITETTPISSRFIQEENYLSGEAISLGFNFRNESWMKPIGISTMRVTANMNDFFRLSSVRVERGIDYPFSRIVSLSLNASF